MFGIDTTEDEKYILLYTSKDTSRVRLLQPKLARDPLLNEVPEKSTLGGRLHTRNNRTGN